MRYFFLVVGPTLGLAILIVLFAVFFLYLSGLATRVTFAYLRRAQIDRNDVKALYSYAEDSAVLFSELVVQLDAKQVVLPEDVTSKIYELLVPPNTKRMIR